MRTHRLRWQLALGQAICALALLLLGTIVLARRNDDVRVAEAAIGAAHDAEVVAEQVQPPLEAGTSIEALLTSSGGRTIEVTDGRSRHLAGATLAIDPSVRTAVRRSIDSLEGAAGADGITIGPRVIGVQPMLSDGELIGVVVVSEASPARRGWRDLFGLDWRAALFLAFVAAGLGWWLAGRITRPLSRLTEQARSLVLSGSTMATPDSRITEVAVLGSALELVGGRINAEAERRDELELDLRRLSHEMRTPLTTLRLRLDDGDTLDAQTLAVVGGQLDRMDRLAEQLSRLRHIRPDGEPLDLCTLARASVNRLRPLAEWGRVEIRVLTTAPVAVVAERAAVEDAISNVVENAIKYSTRGSQVTVRVEQRGEWCVVEVVDSGPGIAAEHRDMVLRPGVRVVGPNGVRGTGQGLAIVAATLDRHGGRLEIGDAPGGGAVIRLMMPSTDE
jgi:signal transduction histidine kinase